MHLVVQDSIQIQFKRNRIIIFYYLNNKILLKYSFHLINFFHTKSNLLNLLNVREVYSFNLTLTAKMMLICCNRNKKTSRDVEHFDLAILFNSFLLPFPYCLFSCYFYRRSFYTQFPPVFLFFSSSVIFEFLIFQTLFERTILKFHQQLFAEKI